MSRSQAGPWTAGTTALRFALERGGWWLSAFLALALIASLAGAVRGGPLDPTAPPGPSMKPLEDLQPSWHRALSASSGEPCNSERFTCVMGGTAVFDRETGLVWQRTLLANAQRWPLAVSICAQRFFGNRWGWRLPTASELMTLIDTSQSAPALPAGHPFDISTLASATFWTATRDRAHPPLSRAFFLNLGTGVLQGEDIQFGGSNRQSWCVRGTDPGIG